jgi:hypothetical protein
MKLLLLLALARAGPMAAFFFAMCVLEWINKGRRE